MYLIRKIDRLNSVFTPIFQPYNKEEPCRGHVITVQDVDLAPLWLITSTYCTGCRLGPSAAHH